MRPICDHFYGSVKIPFNGALQELRYLLFSLPVGEKYVDCSSVW